MVDSFLYAFGRISEDKIGVQQAKKASKTIKQGHHQSHHKYEEYEDKSIGLVHILQGYSKSVKSVSYSPDGQYIVSGSLDKTIKVWNSKTEALLHTLQGHSSLVRSVCYSPDGKYPIGVF